MGNKADKDSNDVLRMILDGEVVTEKIKTKRGDFTIVLPLPRDIRKIEIDIANRLEGMPYSSYSQTTLGNVRAYATLDVVIKEAPSWWEKLESSEDCPDDELILQLYGRYLQFYKTSQIKISKSKFTGDDEVGKPRDKTGSLDNGAFSDITHR